MGNRLREGNHLSILPSQAGQLSILPSVVRETSTSLSEVTFCGPGVKAVKVRLFPLVDKRAGGR